LLKILPWREAFLKVVLLGIKPKETRVHVRFVRPVVIPNGLDRVVPISNVECYMSRVPLLITQAFAKVGSTLDNITSPSIIFFLLHGKYSSQYQLLHLFST